MWVTGVLEKRAPYALACDCRMNSVTLHHKSTLLLAYMSILIRYKHEDIVNS